MDLGEAFMEKITTSSPLLSSEWQLLNIKGAFKQVNILYLPMLLWVKESWDDIYQENTILPVSRLTEALSTRAYRKGSRKQYRTITPMTHTTVSLRLM